MVQQQKQQTFLQFILMIIKGFIKGLPKMIARNLGKTIIVGVGVLVLHTYLLVDINEGFWYDASNKLSPLLNVKETNTGALTLWTIGSMIIVQLWRKCRTNGFAKTIGEIVSSPAWFAQCLRKSGDKKLIALTSGMAVALLASLFIKTKTSLFVFVLMTLLSFSARLQSMMLYAFRLLITDFNRVIRKAPNNRPTVSVSALMVAGIAGGLVLALFIPGSLFIRGILAAVLVALAIFQAKGKISTPMAANIFVFMVIKLVFIKYNIAFADDGGLSEAGGTWISWLGSTGAGTAVAMGAGPALGAVGGGLLGSFLGDIEFDGEFDFGFDDDIPADPDDPDLPEEEFILEDHRDEIEDALEDIDSDLTDEELEEWLDNLDISDEEDLEDFFDDLNDIEKDMEETEKEFEKLMEDMDKSVDEMMDDLDKDMKDLEKALENLSKNPPDPAPEGWLNWGANMINNALGSGLVQEALNSKWKDTFNTCFNQLNELYNSNLDGSALGDLMKNEIFDDIARATNLKNYAGTIDKTLKYGAGFFDALVWWGKGDSVINAGIKGFGNAELMAHLGTKNPALGIMELVNFVGFGGSKASDCISPTKTITGTTNYLYDLATQDADVIADRLKNGDYGPNVKNFVEGAGIAKDAFDKPKEFVEAVKEFTTIKENGDSYYKEMYKSSEELWKVPPDTMKYSPRRLFCWMGKTATDNVIRPFETVAKASNWLGKISSKWF